MFDLKHVGGTMLEADMQHCAELAASLLSSCQHCVGSYSCIGAAVYAIYTVVNLKAFEVNCTGSVNWPCLRLLIYGCHCRSVIRATLF